MDPRTNKDPRACIPAIDPYHLLERAYGLFMLYSNSTIVIIYFDPNTRRIKRNYYYYMDEYDIKLHPKESMSFGDLMLQGHSSGLYQTVPPSSDPNIHLIKTSLDI